MKYYCYLLLTLSLLLLAPNFLPFHLEQLNDSSQKNDYDDFNSDLASQIKSLEDLDNLSNSVNGNEQTLEYWNNVAKNLRQKFYHGYSAYTLQENWVAALAGYFFSPKIYFQYIVSPDDIMKYPMAACSQQGIVLQTLFNKKGINYKTVKFNHHYAVAAEIEGDWYFFDTNIEPDFIDGKRPTLNQIEDIQYLKAIYPQFDFEEVKRVLGKPEYTENNPSMAPKMMFFHQVTYYLSKTLWFFCFLGFIVCLKFNKLRH